MTQARDQVLITPVSVDFLPSIFFKTRGSTNKPFFDDLVIFNLYLAPFFVASPCFLPTQYFYTAWSQTRLTPRNASKSKIKIVRRIGKQKPTLCKRYRINTPQILRRGNGSYLLVIVYKMVNKVNEKVRGEADLSD